MNRKRKKVVKFCLNLGDEQYLKVAKFNYVILLLIFLSCNFNELSFALNISNFRVPAFVPLTLAAGGGGGSQSARPSLELAKPLLFDCDYQYEPKEDARLTVKWFKNKEAEPFYQWLPELNVRHFADWIRPLVNESFVSDPHDPFKRYRSLLVRRLSLNLTGQYTCLVSSLAGEDSRQASLVMYQPPRSFAFEHRIYPTPALLPPGGVGAAPVVARPAPEVARPTQFRGLASLPVHPPNNNVSLAPAGPPAKLVYTHDGRPVLKRPPATTPTTPSAPPARLARRQLATDWQLRQRQRPALLTPPGAYALQLHHFACQASQVSPRPLMVIAVKRSSDSIAQYLHESSSVQVRPRQMNQAEYFNLGSQDELATVYDISVSATVALNVSLNEPGLSRLDQQAKWPSALQVAPATTVLNFRRGQRMSFECHLEITGTEFEQRKRININEDEVYQLAEAELKRRKSPSESPVDTQGGQVQQSSTSSTQSNGARGVKCEPIFAWQICALLASLIALLASSL